jgi:hypothetical protein
VFNLTLFQTDQSVYNKTKGARFICQAFFRIRRRVSCPKAQRPALYRALFACAPLGAASVPPAALPRRDIEFVTTLRQGTLYFFTGKSSLCGRVTVYPWMQACWPRLWDMKPAAGEERSCIVAQAFFSPGFRRAGGTAVIPGG